MGGGNFQNWIFFLVGSGQPDELLTLGMDATTSARVKTFLKGTVVPNIVVSNGKRFDSLSLTRSISHRVSRTQMAFRPL